MRLTKRQRENIAKVFFDLSKYIFTAFIIGQLIVTEKFKLPVFMGGAAAFISFLVIGILADKGE